MKLFSALRNFAVVAFLFLIAVAGAFAQTGTDPEPQPGFIFTHWLLALLSK